MSEPTIETLQDEDRRFPPSPDFAARANAQPEIYAEPFESFWERNGREAVTWFEPFDELYRWELPYAQWYLGGKLNVAYNCVDRHVEVGRGDRVAYHWEGEPAGDTRTITYAELQRDVVRMANALKQLGVAKGTPVAIYMGMVPELAVAMLACTRLGAPHTVVFGGFSADSLSDRMNDMGCEVLVTQDEAWRRGGTVPLKRVADEAMAESPGVRASLVVRRTGNDVPMTDGRDHWYHDVAEGCRTTPLRARASRWTARTSCSSCTRPARPRSRRGSRIRRPATSSASRRHTHSSSTSSPRRTCTGAQPTSAGSRGTATSSTRRSATAPPRCCTRARPTSRITSGGGRSPSATGSRSCTRLRPRSAPT